ncbi:MAG: transposase, partial [Saprospiraceae bacterium]|nr:transposase [Saprospiraceae bacterium]
MKKKKSFDFDKFKEEALSKLKSGEELLGSDGVLTPLIKEFLEESLDGELDAQLEEDDQPNRRNGKGRKTVKTSLGQVDINTPRDRASRFDP